MILSDLACIHICNAMVKEFKRKCVAAFSSLLNDEISKHVYMTMTHRLERIAACRGRRDRINQTQLGMNRINYCNYGN